MNAVDLGTVTDSLVTVALSVLAIILAGGLTAIFLYLWLLYSRIKKREQLSLEMITLEVKMPKDNEIKIDAAEQMFASFASLKKTGFLSFMELDDVIAFEIVGRKTDIRFYVSAPARIIDLVEKPFTGIIRLRISRKWTNRISSPKTGKSHTDSWCRRNPGTSP